jgi:Fur family transcriptional regulator, ferric uptake regulator
MADLTRRWDDVLKVHGYRVTPQRQFVLEAVNRLRHGTPEEILNAVQSVAPGVTLSTVYRVLDVLEEVGLVTHAHIGHGAPTFHAVGAEETHIHLVCERCGTVESLHADDAREFVAHIRDHTGFLTDIGHMALQGICKACHT